jgi:hypothetical protein
MAHSFRSALKPPGGCSGMVDQNKHLNLDVSCVSKDGPRGKGVRQNATRLLIGSDHFVGLWGVMMRSA